MPKDIQTIKSQFQVIQNETIESANTASRVGGAGYDLAEYVGENRTGIIPHFNTESELNASRPNPSNGEQAWVGTPYPGTVWNVVDSVWTDTTVVPDVNTVDLNGYLLSGGTTKTGAQLDNQFSSVFSLVKNPSASFTDAQITALKAIKNIDIYNGDANTRYSIHVLAVNDSQGRYYLRLTELNEAGNIFHTIYLNHDNNITWTEYTNPSGVTFKVLIDMTGLSGNVLNDSTPSVNMVLSPSCFIFDKIEVLIADKNNLTNNRHINQIGGVSNTAGEISATIEYLPVIEGATLRYYGYFGSSNTRLAFYDKANTAMLIHPSSNQVIEGELKLGIPNGASSVRVTTYNNYKDQFKLSMIVSKNTYDKWMYMLSESYSIAGSVTFDDNGIPLSAAIVWSNGNTGRITYSEFDENAFAYRSYEATNTELNKKVVQPPVTFDENGAIQNVPLKNIQTI